MTIENDILAHIAPEDTSVTDRFNTMMPPLPDSAELTVKCRPDRFLASSIARAVEDCDAHLINLNVTGQRDSDGSLLVHLRVNRRSAGPVGRSLERYGYQVVDGGGYGPDSDDYDSTLADRANMLLHILNI